MSKATVTLSTGKTLTGARAQRILQSRSKNAQRLSDVSFTKAERAAESKLLGASTVADKYLHRAVFFSGV